MTCKDKHYFLIRKGFLMKICRESEKTYYIFGFSSSGESLVNIFTGGACFV